MFRTRSLRLNAPGFNLTLLALLAAALTLVVAGSAKAAVVATGESHTCVVTADDKAQCWGANGDGQLGDGTNDDAGAAVDVDTDEMDGDVTAVAAGGAHSCAVVDGELWCWGKNDHGQLGTNTTDDSNVPVKVTIATGMSAAVTDVTAGAAHTCAIAGGAAWCWGDNGSSQLGDGWWHDLSAPVKVLGLSGTVTAISAGLVHTCAIADGAARCWGEGYDGQLGNGSSSSSETAVPVSKSKMSGVVTAISAGDFHTCAVADGGAFCWGYAEDGRVGLGYEYTWPLEVPERVAGMTSGVTDIAAGESHSCAIRAGEVKCWGNGSGGRLGNGQVSTQHGPVAVTGVTDDALAVAAGTGHSCAVLADRVQCWGANTRGQLGQPAIGTSSTAVDVDGLDSVSMLSLGERHACALSNGKVFCWGSSERGKLGDGSMTPAATPREVPGLSGVTAVDAGTQHSCAVAQSKAFCWGYGRRYMLGNGSNTDQSTPVEVIGISDVTAIATGLEHTCAIATQKVFCWGGGDYGRIGVNGSVQTQSPVEVTGLIEPGETVEAIDIGENYSCALVSGVVKCWGYGTTGIPDANGPSQKIPVLPVLPTDDGPVRSLAAGANHACAATDSHTFCWGYNDHGQLGDGTTTRSNVPVEVSGLGTSDALGANSLSYSSTGSSCAVTPAGAVSCWGHGMFGQLGNGAFSSASTPVPVSGLDSGVSDVKVGGGFACAVVGVNAEVKCWGDGFDGQLGDGTIGYLPEADEVPGVTPAEITPPVDLNPPAISRQSALSTSSAAYELKFVVSDDIDPRTRLHPGRRDDPAAGARRQPDHDQLHRCSRPRRHAGLHRHPYRRAGSRPGPGSRPDARDRPSSRAGHQPSADSATAPRQGQGGAQAVGQASGQGQERELPGSGQLPYPCRRERCAGLFGQADCHDQAEGREEDGEGFREAQGQGQELHRHPQVQAAEEVQPQVCDGQAQLQGQHGRGEAQPEGQAPDPLSVVRRPCVRARRTNG